MKNKFKMSVKIGYIDGKYWEILEDVKFENYIVKKGFKTDFASIPKFLRIFFSYSQIYSQSSILHDYLYYKGKKFIQRKKADLIFLKMLKKENVSSIKRYSMYISVRIFGKKYFK